MFNSWLPALTIFRTLLFILLKKGTVAWQKINPGNFTGRFIAGVLTGKGRDFTVKDLKNKTFIFKIK